MTSSLSTRFTQESFMKFNKQLIAGAAMAAIGATANAQAAAATANDPPLQTRAQLRADMAAAMPAGNMVSPGEAEKYPFRLTEAASTLSRSKVKSETAAAKAAGEIPNGELSLQDLQRQPATSEKTRAQVRAETLEARRLGLLQPAGELGLPQATPAQADMINSAGVRALSGWTSAAR
jgi:hypothetical protein